MIYLQISTGQSPAECRLFARFLLHRLLAEARADGLHAEVLDENADRHGPFSAVLTVSGSRAEDFADRRTGTQQWICASPLRPKHPRKNWFVALTRLPEPPPLPDDGGIVFQTCRAGGKGGQHVNKTDSAVRATHTATGLSVRADSERSQHANKKCARQLLALKLAQQHGHAVAQYAKQAHSGLYRLERGNPVRVFVGRDFTERPA